MWKGAPDLETDPELLSSFIKKNNRMRVYVPNACTCPSNVRDGGLTVGWHDLEGSYAKQLLKAEQALDQKGYDALEKQKQVVDKANREFAARSAKSVNRTTSTKKKSPSISSGSKYEKNKKVG